MAQQPLPQGTAIPPAPPSNAPGMAGAPPLGPPPLQAQVIHRNFASLYADEMKDPPTRVLCTARSDTAAIDVSECADAEHVPLLYRLACK
jgi:hypothetical protein